MLRIGATFQAPIELSSINWQWKLYSSLNFPLSHAQIAQCRVSYFYFINLTERPRNTEPKTGT